MKYQVNKTNYADFNVYEVNKLPGRSYFIPYPNRQQADAVSLKEKRYKSPKVICLNGAWDFAFYPIPKELPDVLDTEEVKFDIIDVPSCWQFRGYDKPFYVNIRYQFPFKPPHIPQEKEVGRCFSWIGFDQKISLRHRKPKGQYNFVGVYRRYVTIFDPTKNHIISFLGVASCLDLYINGEFVGYSEGSHNTAEFDISRYLHQGENELVAIVHRWCNGTYLESQDMFRNNGIFRDVLLRISEPTDIFEIHAKGRRTGFKHMLFVQAKTGIDTEVTFTLEGHGLNLKKTIKTKQGVATTTFDLLDVEEWSAENPVLYNVYYETPSCCVKESIGFKDVVIRDDLFYLNGKLVKFKGVNHHDTSPINGYSMSIDEIERDVLLCKEYNIDTIRTSHYPPDPSLLEFADYYGVYVIDENDLETHGVFANHLPVTFNTISNNPKWKNHYLDRITRLYERDKIHGNTCIVMWSLGNESGGYKNTDAMYEFLHWNSDLPVHYESAIHSARIAYDVGSEMYPSVAKVALVGKHRRKQKPLDNRPYFLCEYAHAMGVGPGNMDAYWQQIYQYDNLIGGCVWEMVDHAVLEKDGTYTYGGDHGEWEHDGNFCCDGIFFPDRSPSTGAHIVKFVYRPLRIRHVKGDVFEIFNTTTFTNANSYEVEFEFNDGTKSTHRFDVEPMQKKEVSIPLGDVVDGNLSVLVSVYLDSILKSQEQLTILETILDLVGDRPLPPSFSLDNGKPVIRFPNGDVLKGHDECNLLYRAATDNDTNTMFKNTMKPYYSQTERHISTQGIEHGFEVKTEVISGGVCYRVTDTYEGVEGGILVTCHIHPERKKGYIPRFGKCFYLPSSFDKVEYFGRNGESYVDMKDQFPIGLNKCNVSDMTEPNIKPQESGNRCDCRFAKVSNGSETVDFIAVSKSFELAVKPYSDRDLISMKHRKDEVQTGTYVTIQAFQQGIGTGSCGPTTAYEYKYRNDRDYVLKFLIKLH